MTTGGTIILISLFFGYISAYGTYRDEIPNAYSIPDPCDRTKLWTAIGHDDSEGGGPRNRFGKAFSKAGYSWTKSLCNQDSDADGRTNGEELGDPNCVWVKGATPAVTDHDSLTHPGICEPLDAPVCLSQKFFFIPDCPALNAANVTTTATTITTTEPPCYGLILMAGGLQLEPRGLLDLSLAVFISLVFVVVFTK